MDRTSILVTQIAQHGWGLCVDFIPPEIAKALRGSGINALRKGLFEAAGTGRGTGRAVRPSIRSDQRLWLDQCPHSAALDYYQQALEELRLACNKELMLGLFDLEAHFAVYPVGSFYQRHRDQFHDDDRRVLSTVLYLNENWQATDGGQLRLYVNAQFSQDILPQSGVLLAFLSSQFEHEVLPAWRQRFSIAAWFRRRA